MRRPDLFGRWRLALGAAVLLFLCLLASGARASAPPEREEMSATAPSPVAAQSRPMASGCMPCALCYVAPAPKAHSYTGECKEPELATWWARRETIPSKVRILGIKSSHVPVPIRIALCRSLD